MSKRLGSSLNTESEMMTEDIRSVPAPPRPIETIDHPAHYNQNPSGVECITVVEHMGFNLGSAMKYLWRAGFKGALIEDLRKSIWYIQREIQRLEKEQKCPLP